MKEGVELQVLFQHERPLIRFHSFLVFLLTFGSRPSRVGPSAERETLPACLPACLPANLCSGQTPLGGDDETYPGLALHHKSAQHTVQEAADGDLGDPAGSTLPCRTNKQDPVPRVLVFSQPQWFYSPPFTSLAKPKDPISDLHRA